MKKQRNHSLLRDQENSPEGTNNETDLFSLIDRVQKGGNEARNQDGRVEGRALTPSCENTRITTSCWTIIDRKTLELTKKDTPHPKTKEKPK